MADISPIKERPLSRGEAIYAALAALKPKQEPRDASVNAIREVAEKIEKSARDENASLPRVVLRERLEELAGRAAKAYELMQVVDFRTTLGNRAAGSSGMGLPIVGKMLGHSGCKPRPVTPT